MSEYSRSFLEYRAREVDAWIERKLLRDLILKYADAQKRVQELSRLKNTFVGIAAHDLRNPLSSIIGLTALMTDGTLGEIQGEQRSFLETIESTAQGMLKMVNNLLDISAIESGKLDLDLACQSLKPILDDRIRIIAFAATRKEIAIEPTIEDDTETNVDRGRIAQVMDNLMSNAIKFSPPGSTVRIRLFRDGDTIKCSVTDQGPGLSADDKKKLFGEFQKLSARPTAGEKSTGLGLAIVKKTVEAHGGTIEVESEPGQGATFTFGLPV